MLKVGDKLKFIKKNHFLNGHLISGKYYEIEQTQDIKSMNAYRLGSIFFGDIQNNNMLYVWDFLKNHLK